MRMELWVDGELYSEIGPSDARIELNAKPVYLYGSDPLPEDIHLADKSMALALAPGLVPVVATAKTAGLRCEREDGEEVRFDFIDLTPSDTPGWFNAEKIKVTRRTPADE